MNGLKIEELPDEIWKPIQGHDSYFASNLGNIKNCRKQLKQYVDHRGYMSCGIKIEGRFRATKVHRLIALAFVPNPENKPFINHIDGIKKNNLPENLEWVTQSENIQHAWDMGLCGNYERSEAQKHKGVMLLRKAAIATSVDGAEKLVANSISDLAEKIGVKQSTISQAIKRRGLVSKKWIISLDKTTLPNNK